MSKKPFFQKINYQLWSRKWWPISAYWSTTIEKKANTNTKTKQESHIGPKNAKNCPVQEYCSKNTTIQNNQRLWKTFPKKKNKNAKKNRKPQKPPPKKNLQKYAQKKKQQKLPFTKHETKHKPNKIHNNRLKTNKYRV